MVIEAWDGLRFGEGVLVSDVQSALGPKQLSFILGNCPKVTSPTKMSVLDFCVVKAPPMDIWS